MTPTPAHLENGPMLRLGLTIRLGLLMGFAWVMLLLALSATASGSEVLRHPAGLLLGLAGLLLVTGGTHLLTARLRRRIDGAAAIMRGLHDGPEPEALPVGGPPAIRRFAESFNELVESFSNRLRESEAKYRESLEGERLLETILSAMCEAVLAVDRTGRVLFSNETAREVFRTEGDLTGRQLVEVSRDSALAALIESALTGGREQQAEVELRRSGRTVDARAVPLPAMSGGPNGSAGSQSPGVIVILDDVTELRALEAMRTNFVSNVSHELKTPLAAIRGYIETLLDGAHENPAYRDRFLRGIDRQAERLRILIEDLLSLARIESAESGYHVRPVSLTRALSGCVEELRSYADLKSVAVTFDGPADDVIVPADPEGLRSLFGNLIDNGINYTRAGGSVAVTLETDESHAFVFVRDTGVGIPEEHLPRVFERFYRVDKARSREVGGTGLGLAIVKHLVRLFEGDVHVVSEVGEGTLFTVRLPLASATAAANAPSR